MADLLLGRSLNERRQLHVDATVKRRRDQDDGVDAGEQRVEIGFLIRVIGARRNLAGEGRRKPVPCGRSGGSMKPT